MTRLQQFQRAWENVFGVKGSDLAADIKLMLGFTPENTANKSTNVTTDGASNTKYPSVKAIKDYTDAKAIAATSLAKVTQRIQHSDLTDAVNGEAQVVNVGAALPANAVVVAHEVQVDTLFSGGSASAVKLDLGGTAPTAIANQMDVFTGAATGALSPRTGAHAQGKFGGQQLAAKFTPDGGHTLLGLTAGDVTITVWYVVLA